MKKSVFEQILLGESIFSGENLFFECVEQKKFCCSQRRLERFVSGLFGFLQGESFSLFLAVFSGLC